MRIVSREVAKQMCGSRRAQFVEVEQQQCTKTKIS